MPALDLQDASLSYDDHGAGPPVLLLHGFPTTRALWSAVVPPLVAAGHRVIAVDLAGYGDSTARDSVRIDMASQAAWLLRLLDHLGLARTTLVAHDIGSAAAQLLAAKAPQRVRGLVVADGVYRSEWAMEAVASIRAWDLSQAARLLPVLARRLAKTSSHLRGVLAAYEGEAGGRRLIRAACDLDPQQTAAIDEALRSAGVPALVLWGERDTFLPIETVARPLAAQLGAQLVFVPGGHFTPSDCPAEVAEALLGFLGRLPA